MEINLLLSLLLFAFVHCVWSESGRKIVETRDGGVRGKLKYTLYRNVSYYSFLGIPYAEKPIDDLRFKV